MPKINEFPSKPEHQRRLQAIKERQLAQKTSDAEHGKQALEAFDKARREKLSLEDRRTIANNLSCEVQKFAESDKGTKSELLEEAGIAINHLDRFALPPGKAGKAELNATPPRYIKLLEALSKKGGDDLDLLADRVLLGTRFHPESLANLQEAQLIFEALQVVVDRIDREFNLWEQCQAVAAIRKPLEVPYYQALHDGDEAALAKFLDENPSHIVGNPIKLWWPIDDFHLIDYEADAYVAPVNPFWAKRYLDHGDIAAGVCMGEEIFFFPHIYLGPAIEWSGWRDGPRQPTMSPSVKEEILAAIQATPEPRVLFNKETENYQVYQEGAETGENRINGTDWDWGEEEMGNAARWLVIYPDPEARRLVPAIYTRGSLQFVELVPLSARLIAEFGDSDRWQYVGEDAPTLLQRLKNLTGFDTGDFKVMDAWRETAARFHLNPIFRSHPGEDKKILYRRHLENWITENQRSLDRHEDEE